MAITAATGSAISFGRVNKVFTNNDPGAAGNAPSGGQNIKLSTVLGNNGTYGIGQAVGTQIRFSQTFWGKVGSYG